MAWIMTFVTRALTDPELMVPFILQNDPFSKKLSSGHATVPALFSVKRISAVKRTHAHDEGIGQCQSRAEAYVCGARGYVGEMNLLGDDSEDELKFTVNQDYAKRYDKWRQGEELQKLKDKYGDEVDSEESSSSDEDEDAVELTKDVEKEFFKTLSCLKEKNPKIYDKNFRFFKSRDGKGEEQRGRKGKGKEPSMTLGEYQRKVLLEKGGQFSDEEDDEQSLRGMTNVEQEKAIKESFRDVLRDSESDNDEGNWGGLFQKRVKTKEELQAEEEDYKLWLAGEKEKLGNREEENELKGLHDYWSDPKLNEGERFLRDYILNKRFLEKNNTDRIPAYDEVVHDSDSGLSADENTLQQQEQFERKYNFRFEEPDQEFIKRYPRTLEQSMRKKDERRKKHREEVKARKEKEKAKKVEELKQLKALKKKEIMEKIKKLQEITGNDDMGFQKKDLEEDFDPEKHDQRMKELFNEEYYGACEDEKKPEYPELDKELEIENWDEWGGEGNEGEEEELHCEDPGFNMDCDYDPSEERKLQKELIEASKKRKKRRQSKFSAAVAKPKPVFDPKDKTFEKYVDEYYALDYEDLIGDLPCRFKYRKVVPNDFGLSVEEILAAPDKELNRWVSLKKIMQRRPEHVELYDVKAYKKKARDFDKKRKFLPSLYSNEDEKAEALEEEANGEQKETSRSKEKRKGLKRKKSDALLAPNGSSKEKKKKKFSSEQRQSDKRKDSQHSLNDISDSRLKSYGINPKKMKNKLKYGKKGNKS